MPFSSLIFSILKRGCNLCQNLLKNIHGLFTILEQRYIFNDEKIYDMINDIIWEYSEKTNNWNNVGKCSATLREGQIYYNESTKQTFYYTNGNAYCIGNGN